MTVTNIRATVIAFVTAFAVAATIVPAAQAVPRGTATPPTTSAGTAPTGGVTARKNNGKFQTSAEKLKKAQELESHCDALLNHIGVLGAKLENAEKERNWKEYDRVWGLIQGAYWAMKSSGCFSA